MSTKPTSESQGRADSAEGGQITDHGGDVRSGSTKRAAAAVSEGDMAIRLV